MKRFTQALSFVLLGSLLLPSSAAAGDARTVVQFDPAAGEFAEGVAAARHGEVFAGLSGLGRMVQVAVDGSVSDVHQLALADGDFGLTGLAIDPAAGSLYAAVNSADPTLHGVVAIGRGQDEALHIDGTEAMAMPNAIAFGDDDTSDAVMYITDSAAGQVWRSEWEGWVGWHPAQLWLAGPLLEGTGELPFPFPVGANGVAVDDGVVYVGVTEQSHIVGIPIEPDGSAGTPFVHLELPGVAIDGIGVTADGDFVVADPPANIVWIVGDDGVPVVLADAEDGISGPTSVYMDGALDAQPVYVANMAQAVIGELAPHPPSIVAIELD